MSTIKQSPYLAYLVHPDRDIQVQFTWSDDHAKTVAITFYQDGRSVGHNKMMRDAAKDLWAKLSTEGYTRSEVC